MADPAVPADVPARRSWLADRGVNTRVLACIVLAALVAVVVWITGFIDLKQTSAAANTIARDNVVSVEAVGALRTAFTQARLDATNQALSNDPQLIQSFTDAFTGDIEEFEAALKAYQATGPAGAQASVDELASTWNSYVTIAQERLLPLGVANRLDAWARVRDEQVLPLATRGNELLDELTQAEKADAAANAEAAAATHRHSRNLAAAVLVLGVLLALGVGILVARSILRPLHRVQAACEALAAGDLTRRTGLTSNDETGQMGRALDAAVCSLRQTVGTIGESATSLAGAAEELTTTASRIAASAQVTSAQSQRVAETAEEISRSVDTVASGGEEMGAAIREISQNAAEAAQVAEEAVRLTETTSTTMAKLGESSVEIGNIVKVITSIAEQTNLLALNATIEAARAGEAGKGFAVVADEVKQLAQETARATEDISQRVQAIQNDTGGSVEAITEVSAVIQRISEFQTTIASAVEEQSATTAEMNRSVSEAAAGTGDISRNIDGVATAAATTSQGADETQTATADLARMSAQLNSVVAGFRL